MIKIDINPGDIILTGKFKNKSVIVKALENDEMGQPLIVTSTGKKIKLLAVRIKKLMPKKNESLSLVEITKLLEEKAGKCEWCGKPKENKYGMCSNCGRFPSTKKPHSNF